MHEFVQGILYFKSTTNPGEKRMMVYRLRAEDPPLRTKRWLKYLTLTSSHW